MSEYVASGAPGSGANQSMNGSGENNFQPPTPMPSNNEAAKTLW